MQKYKKVKTDDLLNPGQVKVTYTPGEMQNFELVATNHGVELKGFLSLTEYDQLEPLAHALSEAWKDYMRLKREIAQRLQI